MKRRTILAAAACLSLPTFLKANPTTKPFPFTRAKSGEGLYLWLEVHDLNRPSMGPLCLVQEVNLDEGWVDQIVSDGKNIRLNAEGKLPLRRLHGNFEMRWKTPTEEDIKSAQEKAELLSQYNRHLHWNEEVASEALTIPAGCIASETSVADATNMARLLVDGSLAAHS